MFLLNLKIHRQNVDKKNTEVLRFCKMNSFKLI